jgi:hypothetical protein
LDPLDFILIALAAWRVASLLVNEDGPFNIFAGVRGFFTQEGEVRGIGLLLTCVWCTSVWTAILCYLVWSVWEPPIIVLAASALAIAVEEKAVK